MSRQRAVLIVLTTLVLTLVAAAPAGAGRQWCEKDPVFLIAGRQVNVVVAIMEDHQPAVVGPIVVTLYVPDDVNATLVSTDDGYNGYGEVASIVPVSWLTVTKRGVQVRVEVILPASLTEMPVKVIATPADGRTTTARGNANVVIPLDLTVSPAS
jgi:hypothetical protein